MKALLPFTMCFLMASCHSRMDDYNREWSQEDKNRLIADLTTSIAELQQDVALLTDKQWYWKPDTATWSIAMVVEHLITHDELFYREVQVLTALPEMPVVSSQHFSDDDTILSYREITPQNRGTAPAYLQPLGRWCSKADAMQSYGRVRQALIQLVEGTNKDLRKYYTSSGRGPTKYRDLHQLLLISVAHTQRHHKQILEIASAFPPQ